MKSKFNDLFYTFSHRSFLKTQDIQSYDGLLEKGRTRFIILEILLPIGVHNSWGFDYFDGYFILNDLKYALGFSQMKNYTFDKNEISNSILVHFIFLYFYTF